LKLNSEENLKEIAEYALTMAAKHGAAAEAFLLYERELALEVAQSEVQSLKQAEQAGMGIRVLKQGRVGFAFTGDLTSRAVSDTVDHAVAIADHTTADEYNLLPRGNFSYPALETYDKAIAVVTLEEKISLAQETEKYARAYDKRVTVVERSAYDDNEAVCVIMNTEGVYAAGRANYCGLNIYLVAEEAGEAQSGFAMMSGNYFSDLCPQQLGVEAAIRAGRSLGAKAIPSAHLPCIMEPVVTARFLSVLAQLVDAGAVQKGKSMLAGKLGQVVAAPVVSLVDDGLNQDGIPFPFDAEGVPSRTTTVIEKGILKSFLYDTYTAAKAGVSSTGNAQRASFRTFPAVGITNFMISGTSEPEALISDIEQGLYITDVMGMHTANPISGDFSVGAAGIMIEGGRLTFPVRGITIAGNLGQLLKDIDAVGNDLRFFGTRGASTIRIKSLSIGGK
jgi:PmbA protein